MKNNDPTDPDLFREFVKRLIFFGHIIGTLGVDAIFFILWAIIHQVLAFCLHWVYPDPWHFDAIVLQTLVWLFESVLILKISKFLYEDLRTIHRRNTPRRVRPKTKT